MAFQQKEERKPWSNISEPSRVKALRDLTEGQQDFDVFTPCTSPILTCSETTLRFSNYESSQSIKIIDLERNKRVKQVVSDFNDQTVCKTATGDNVYIQFCLFSSNCTNRKTISIVAPTGDKQQLAKLTDIAVFI